MPMKPVSRRSLIKMAAASAPLAMIAACGDGSSGAASATGSRAPGAAPASSTGTLTGTVNFLNFTGWAGPTTYADFAAAFPGATVNEIAWASNDDTISKAKDRAGDIDVVLVDGTTFPRLTALGVLAELGEVPNLSLVADQYKGNSWDPDNASFAPTDHGRTGIIYRKDLVSTPPTSWAEFFALAPDYSGKVAVLDYQGSVMDNVLVMLGKPVGSTDEADLAEVLDVLTTVKPHLLAISTEVGKAVAAGDAVMAMCDAYDAQLALTTNPDVVFVDPSEGQVGYLEGLAILDGPRNDLGPCVRQLLPRTSELRRVHQQRRVALRGARQRRHRRCAEGVAGDQPARRSGCQAELSRVPRRGPAEVRHRVGRVQGDVTDRRRSYRTTPPV